MTDQIIQLETMIDEGHSIIKLTDNDHTVTDEKTSMTDKIRTDIEETTETITELIIMITPEITKDGHTGMTRLNFPACHINGTVTIITMMQFFWRRMTTIRTDGNTTDYRRILKTQIN